MLANFAIDNQVFLASLDSAQMIVHASSACAYPISLQDSETDVRLLNESAASLEVSEKCFPDGVYGWTKLMGEYQLENTVRGTRTKGRSARIFTAYGERENESHAAIALMAKAMLRFEPYPIWGSGEQTRNFTHVVDTVTGILLLGSDPGERTFDVFNVGTSEHIKVIDFVRQIFSQIRWTPDRIELQTDKPTGVASRAADNSKIMSAFGWCPTIGIAEGLSRTHEWYMSKPDRPTSAAELERLLMAR